MTASLTRTSKDDLAFIAIYTVQGLVDSIIRDP